MGKVYPRSTKAITPDQIGRFTRLLRAILNIENRKSQNILLTFELLKKVFPRLRIRIVEDMDLPEAEAQAYPKYWIIKIRRGIYEGLLRGDVGARWTFAHELGHVLLRHHGRPHRRRQSGQNRIEREAHAFAARLLAPSELVREYSLPEDVAKAFKLSSKAARHRLWELKLEDRNKASDIRATSASYSTTDRKTEHLTSIICSTISSTMAELPSDERPIEVWKDNLFSTSVLVTTASQLLLEAYESIRRHGIENQFVQAACALAAVATIKPIREIGRSTTPSTVVLSANEACAFNTAKRLLREAPLQAATFADTENLAEVECIPTFAFLNSLSQKYNELVSDCSVLVHLSDLPTYVEYSESCDITWLEINNIERLAKFLASCASKEDAAPRRGSCEA